MHQHKRDLALNHAHPVTVRTSLNNQLIYLVAVPSAMSIKCATFQSGKVSRHPHYCVTHNYAPWLSALSRRIWTLQTTGARDERYFITFTDFGSQFTFLITIESQVQITEAIQAAFIYAKKIRGKYPRVFHWENSG